MTPSITDSVSVSASLNYSVSSDGYMSTREADSKRLWCESRGGWLSSTPCKSSFDLITWNNRECSDPQQHRRLRPRIFAGEDIERENKTSRLVGW